MPGNARLFFAIMIFGEPLKIRDDTFFLPVAITSGLQPLSAAILLSWRAIFWLGLIDRYGFIFFGFSHDITLYLIGY